ncbi:Putative mannosyltransferase 1, CMT1 [Colletotrichum destructivum]|uniref:Mannosyltransferase 1, CMT1 n=1 Tax=Colletotrichum destructivum TaxID=34406 RepID=A0AAX4IML9_9PEZI|nr:Putative mannosyltransferase 1, CMT1 [Colletotrichum destructivum]
MPESDDIVYAETRPSSSIEDSDLDHEHKEPLLPGSASVSQRRGRGTIVAWLRGRPRSLLRRFRRQPRSLPRLLLRYTFLFVLFVLTATPIFFPSYTRHPKHYKDLRKRCLVSDSLSGCANLRNEKVFIAVSLFDPEGKITGGEWAKNVLDLIHMIGEDNTFLSIYENDSGDLGAAALDEFKKNVPCKHRIVSEGQVDYSAFPHVTLPDGSQRLKRLAYLSEMRNRALYPLDQSGQDPKVGTVKYDKILFLNDALFAPVDAAHLLFNTNAGEDGRAHYLSACSLDYDWNPFLEYDLYAQRDAEGYSNGIPIFPYFTGQGKAVSRRAMVSQTDAVPVKSCWGGMVAMQAKWVQNVDEKMPTKDWQAVAHHVIDPDHPHNVTAPVRFRYEPELYFDACECCLFLADVTTVADKAGEPDMGVFVNPYVRVAYRKRTQRLEPLVRRWERLLALPQAIITHFSRFPTPNPHRQVVEGQRFTEEIYQRREGWKMVERTGRNGMFCGVREMQLIKEGPRNGRNWENNYDIPWDKQTLNFPL